MCTDILFRYKSGAYPVKDTAEVDLTFLTGETAPTVSYLDTLDNSTDRRIYFTGDDCIGGDFQPQPMTMYSIFLWWSGMDYQGVVRASEYDPISVVMTLEEDDLLE